MARPRSITKESLDSIQESAKKFNGSLIKACRQRHKRYGSVLAAARVLNHPILGLVRSYAPRKNKQVADAQVVAPVAIPTPSV